MIEVWTLYDNKIKTNITPLLKSVSISGSKTEVARTLECTTAYSIFDLNHDHTQAGTGTKVWCILDGKEIFRGVIFTRELNSSEELNFTAYDYLIYLNKSKVTYNFKNITPEDGTKKICSELGISAGNIAVTGIKSNRLIAQKTGYEAIMELYTQASKQNKKQYIPVMDSLKLSVIEKGKTVSDNILKIGSNIIGTSYKDTLDNMINKVKIYDDKNNYIGEVKNDTWIKNFGVLQENYTKEQDENPYTVAKNILHSVDQECEADVLGDWSYRTGNAVRVQIPYLSNLKDTMMYIDSDTHTWDISSNQYTTSLTLNFKNIMDIKEA